MSVDPELVRDMMRSHYGGGDGISPVPSVGAGLSKGVHRQRFHLMKPMKEAQSKQELGKSIMDDLKMRIKAI